MKFCNMKGSVMHFREKYVWGSCAKVVSLFVMQNSNSSICDKMQVLRCSEIGVAHGNKLFQRSNKFPVGARLASAVRTTPEVSVQDHTKEEYQFLPRGRLPTYYFQKSLPRLPIPKLELTCQRYVESLQPLLEELQLRRTEKAVQSFEQGIGRS